MTNVDTQKNLVLLMGLLRQGQMAEAVRLSETLTKTHSELALPWLVMAQAAEKNGKSITAELCFSKVLTLETDSLIARAGLALMTMHQLKLPEARIHFREALRLLLRLDISSAVATPKPAFNTSQNEFLLWQALVQLAKHNIHGVAHAGSLLGLIREGSLLPADKDLDIALPHHEIPAAVECLRRIGWEVNPLPMPLINPISCRHTETGLILDLCGVRVEKDSDKVLSGFWTQDPRDDWQRITVFSQPFSIEQRECAAGLIWALKAPDSWLTDLYGNWREPDPGFDTSIFAVNMRGFSLLTQCYAYNRLIWNWKKGHFTKALRIAQVMSDQFPDDVLLSQCVLNLTQYLPKSGERVI